MSRRWDITPPFDFDGLRFRIERGRKVTKLGEKGKDLRLDVHTGERWRPVHMRLGGFLCDFFYENENILFPPFTPDLTPTRWQGGEYYIKYLQKAGRKDWRTAEAQLRAERAQRDLEIYGERVYE